MKQKVNGTSRASAQALGAAALVFASASGHAQFGAPTTATAPSSDSIASEPNPYYLGARGSFTHSTNVNQAPGGHADNYWTTSVFGGFDQPIGRQRVFGRADIGYSRYSQETQLNNTTYDISGGLDWSTVESLSGSVHASLSQYLEAPAVVGFVPDLRANTTNTQNIDALVRYGGPSLLSIEGTVGYSTLDYSLPEYQSSEARSSRASVGLYYHPGGPLRVGIGVRYTSTDSPESAPGITPPVVANTSEGRNIDLSANYDVSGHVSAGGRLSYTNQTNSGITAADFSGWTGSLYLSYRPTGKLLFNAYASRDPGFSTQSGWVTQTFLVGTTPITTRQPAVFQVAQLISSVGLGVTYSATAKINATAGVSYGRTTMVAQAGVETIDDTRAASLGVTYDVARNWQLGCNLQFENRDVSGGVNYTYDANSFGCLAQYRWP